MTTQLAPDFTLEEFELGPAIPPEYLGNVTQLANLLQAFRDAGGGYPLEITSGYRSALTNELAGGVSTSQHLTASAADFHVVGLDNVSWIRAALASGVPTFGQLILELDGHIHLSLPGNHQDQVLAQTGSTQYTPWDVSQDPPTRGEVHG